MHVLSGCNAVNGPAPKVAVTVEHRDTGPAVSENDYRIDILAPLTIRFAFFSTSGQDSLGR